MAINYFNTEKVMAFPVSGRKKGKSVFLSESNLVNILNVITEIDNYMINPPQSSSEEAFDVVLHGYFFRIYTPKISDPNQYLFIMVNNSFIDTDESFNNLIPFSTSGPVPYDNEGGKFCGISRCSKSELESILSDTDLPDNGQHTYYSDSNVYTCYFLRITDGNGKWFMNNIYKFDGSTIKYDGNQSLKSLLDQLKETKINGTKISEYMSNTDKSSSRWGKTTTLTLSSTPSDNPNVILDGTTSPVTLNIPKTLGTNEDPVIIKGKSDKAILSDKAVNISDENGNLRTVGGVTGTTEITNTNIKLDNGIIKESYKVYMKPYNGTGSFPEPPTSANKGDIFIVYEE